MCFVILRGCLLRKTRKSDTIDSSIEWQRFIHRVDFDVSKDHRRSPTDELKRAIVLLSLLSNTLTTDVHYHVESNTDYENISSTLA